MWTCHLQDFIYKDSWNDEDLISCWVMLNMSSDDSGTRTVFQSDLFPKHSFCTFSIWRKQEHL